MGHIQKESSLRNLIGNSYHIYYFHSATPKSCSLFWLQFLKVYFNATRKTSLEFERKCPVFFWWFHQQVGFAALIWPSTFRNWIQNEWSDFSTWKMLHCISNEAKLMWMKGKKWQSMWTVSTLNHTQPTSQSPYIHFTLMVSLTST